MAWTTYAATDGAAPVLTGQVGSLVALLDAVLVDGYGAKPAAGWSKAFAGTHKAAYRNGAGATARKYLRVQDDGPGTGAAREARVRGFDAMTGIDSGTIPFPSDAQQSNAAGSLVWRKSYTTDATARDWIAFADDRTLILFIKTGDTGNRWLFLYAGEYQSFRPSDAHAFALLGGSSEAATTLGFPAHWALHVQNHFPAGINGPQSSPRVVVAGNIVGGASSAQCCTAGLAWTINLTATSTEKLQFPNAIDNAAWLSPVTLVSEESGNWCARGNLRGVFIPCHIWSLSDGDTITGSGDLATQAFRVVREVYFSNATASQSGFSLAINTTAPAQTP